MAREANLQAIQRIKDAQAKSLKIMQMDKNGSLDRIAENKRGAINSSIDSNGEEVNVKQMVSENNKSMMQPMARREMRGASASKIPTEILESFKKTPYQDDSALMMETLAGPGDLSMLNDMAITPKAEPQQREIIQEVQTQQSNQVDYSLIRTIVEESVRKYVSSLGKKLINENKEQFNEINTISLGKTFKFLAKNGDLYECTMKKIGNINKARKGAQ